MNPVDVEDAQKRFPELVARAAKGTDVVVSRNGRPVVRITRLERPKRDVTFGVLKGKLRIPGGLDAPLSDDVLSSFEGR